MLAALVPGATIHAGDVSDSYTWKPLRVGAGGYITGMWAHPTVPGLMYCRVDVAAGYRWEPKTNSWKNILTASSMPSSVLTKEYAGVDSIVGSKSDPDCAYLAYGGRQDPISMWR